MESKQRALVGLAASLSMISALVLYWRKDSVRRCGRKANRSNVKSRETTIYVARHGTSEWNLKGLWQGETDTVLAPQGIAQATEAAERFLLGGVVFDVAFCSDLKRAHATARILSKPHRVEPVPCAELRECGLGEFEGLHRNEVLGPKYAALFHRLEQLSSADRLDTSYFPHLETPRELCTRVMDLLRKVLEAHEGKTILLVTHSTILEALCAVLFEQPYERVQTETLGWMHWRLRPIDETKPEPAMPPTLPFRNDPTVIVETHVARIPGFAHSIELLQRSRVAFDSPYTS